MPKFPARKSCVVPKCPNTTSNAPEKLFFFVPLDPKSRKKWMQIMRRADPPKPNSRVYCCEDHFDIETDMENYLKYKLVGGIRKLKQGVVPHKFECQALIKKRPGKSAVNKRNGSSALDMHESEFVDCCFDNDMKVDPLSDVNNQSSEKILQNKAVQVELKNKVVHKATMTEEKYFKKENKNSNKKATKRPKRRF